MSSIYQDISQMSSLAFAFLVICTQYSAYVQKYKTILLYKNSLPYGYSVCIVLRVSRKIHQKINFYLLYYKEILMQYKNVFSKVMF